MFRVWVSKSSAHLLSRLKWVGSPMERLQARAVVNTKHDAEAAAYASVRTREKSCIRPPHTALQALEF